MLPPPTDLDAGIDARVRELLGHLGPQRTVAVCADLLTGAEPHEHADVLPYLAGRPAASVLDGSWPAYWARAWGGRGLLRVWDDAATDAVVAALDDEAWRPAEMALKVVARHEVGAGAPGAATLAGHELARVRAAAVRALGAVGETEHVDAVVAALDDPDPAVRRAAARAIKRLVRRLDLDPAILDQL